MCRSSDILSTVFAVVANAVEADVKLFFLACRRTHGGGLLRLGINSDQCDSAHARAASGNHVSARSQVVLHTFRQGRWHRKATQVGAILAEGADEVRG